MGKILINTWFGEKIPWADKYFENFAKTGWKMLTFSDKDYGSNAINMTPDEFMDLYESKLGMRIKDWDPTSDKYFDFRPAYGVIFEDYIKGYDFWGHTDHDCVYGNLDKFVDTDCDIFSNDPYPTICGHFSIWKNTPKVNNLFKEYPLWRDMLSTMNIHVFERPISGNLSPMSWTTKQLVDDGEIIISYDYSCQGNDKMQHQLRYDDGLFCDGKEIAIYHFRKTKQWPL